MQLYLMRHAEAEKLSESHGSDAQRRLTDHGRRQAEATAKELKRKAIIPVIAASPYVRTVETAEILRIHLGCSPIVTDNALASSGHAPDLPSILQSHPSVEHLILVGHQPDLGLLASQLLGFEFGFSPATLIAFELQSSKARYLWTYSPE